MPPEDIVDWAYVAEFMDHHRSLQRLVVRIIWINNDMVVDPIVKSLTPDAHDQFMRLRITTWLQNQHANITTRLSTTQSSLVTVLLHVLCIPFGGSSTTLSVPFTGRLEGNQDGIVEVYKPSTVRKFYLLAFDSSTYVAIRRQNFISCCDRMRRHILVASRHPRVGIEKR